MFIAFPIILFSLLAISVMSVVTFYLANLLKQKETFDNLLIGAIIYIFANSFYAFNIELFYPSEPWKDQLMPFGLGYGPLLFFGVIALKNKRLRVWELIVHSLPFCVYFILFIILLLGLAKNIPDAHHLLGKHIFFLGSLSFVSYSIWSAFAGRSLFKGKLKQKAVMFIFARMLLIFLSLIFIIIYASHSLAGNQQAIYFFRMIVYSCLFIAIVTIFSYIVHKLLKIKAGLTVAVETPPQLATGKMVQAQYERSPLSAAQLALYEKKLVTAIKKEKLYLDQNLSLSSLSSHLKIPNHHLTQVFNMQLKQTFYQYVNGFRILHACNLLKSTHQPMKLEELAEHSGFNSKVSFNRQFKLINGCTPSEYRNKLQN